MPVSQSRLDTLHWDKGDMLVSSSIVDSGGGCGGDW